MIKWDLRDEIAKIIAEDVAEDISSASIADRIIALLERSDTDQSDDR